MLWVHGHPNIIVHADENAIWDSRQSSHSAHTIDDSLAKGKFHRDAEIVGTSGNKELDGCSQSAMDRKMQLDDEGFCLRHKFQLLWLFKGACLQSHSEKVSWRNWIFYWGPQVNRGAERSQYVSAGWLPRQTQGTIQQVEKRGWVLGLYQKYCSSRTITIFFQRSWVFLSLASTDLSSHHWKSSRLRRARWLYQSKWKKYGSLVKSTKQVVSQLLYPDGSRALLSADYIVLTKVTSENQASFE